MSTIVILKKNGDEKRLPVRENVLQAWAIMTGIKTPEAIAELTEDVSEQMYETRLSWNPRTNRILDYVVFKSLDGKNLVINKRFVAWIEE